ncbi:MAG: hypothetical protein NC911_06075 [Candidatus Omnitrophica bacterium]|nr:hypothetical protein [Candidatus Omnitrophota bacterium]
MLKTRKWLMGKRFSIRAAGCLMLFPVAFFPLAVRAENHQYLKLQDAGFENIVVQGNSFGTWLFYGGPASTPEKRPELVAEAAEGRTAIKMKTGYLRQTLPLSPDAWNQTITLSLKARGQGELQVFLTYGEVRMDWKDIQDFFPLTEEFLPYHFRMKVPEKATSVQVNFGVSGLSWAVVDEISLTLGTSPFLQTTELPQTPLPGNIKLVNISRFATCRTRPYGTLLWRLTDGRMGTGAILEFCPESRVNIYEFIYPQPQEIAKIRWSLPSSSYRLLADTEGDGTYEKQLALVTGEKPISHWGRQEWPWAEASFWPPLKISGVKLTNFARRNSTIFEFEIWAPENQVKKLVSEKEKYLTGLPELTKGQPVNIPEPQQEEQFLKGVHIEAWMWNLPGLLQQKPRPKLSQWKYFQKMLSDIKGLKANFVWLFPPRTWVETATPEGKKRGGQASDVMWPSQWARYSFSENLLQEFCDTMHQEGIKVFTQFRGIQLREPTEQEKTLFAPVVNQFYRNGLAGLAREQVLAGVDGVAVCEDEDYCRVALLISANVQTRETFLKETSLKNIPTGLEDTEAMRKWYLFWFTHYARSIQEVCQAVKQTNPQALTVTNIMADGAYNSRLDWGVAYDIIGHTADIDYFGTDPYFTLEENDLGHYRPAAMAKRLLAGNKKRQAIVTLNCPWAESIKKHPLFYQTFPKIAMAGQVLSATMQGGTSCAYYRLQEYLFYEGYDQAARQIFSMLDTLAAWGMKQAKIPEMIAVLGSRAGQDWWQLKKRCEPQVEAYDTIRGFAYEKAVMELLFVHGYPFHFYYQDQPQTLPDLSSFALIILPFPYSLNQTSFEKIKAAVQRGTKLLVFDRLGEVDEYGNPYPRPLLAELEEKGNFFFVREDILREGFSIKLQENLCKKIDALLGQKKRIFFRRYSQDVELACLEKGEKEKFICLINWSGQPATVDVGLLLPTGRYQGFCRDGEATKQVLIASQPIFSEKQLRLVRISLAENEMVVFYFFPEEKK